jgi:hypothetical protein
MAVVVLLVKTAAAAKQRRFMLSYEVQPGSTIVRVSRKPVENTLVVK